MSNEATDSPGNGQGPSATNTDIEQSVTPNLALIMVVGVIALAIWVWTGFKAFDLHKKVTDLSNDWFDGPSAVQISQVADQSQLELMPYLAAAFGSTLLFGLTLVYQLLKRPRPSFNSYALTSMTKTSELDVPY